MTYKEMYVKADRLPALEEGFIGSVGFEKLYRVLLEKWGLIEKSSKYELYFSGTLFYDGSYDSSKPETITNDGDYYYERYLFDGKNCLYNKLLDTAFEKSGLGKSHSGGFVHNRFMDENDDEDELNDYLMSSPYKLAKDTLHVPDIDKFLAIDGLLDCIVSAMEEWSDDVLNNELYIATFQSRAIGAFSESALLKDHPDDPLVEQTVKLIKRVSEPFGSGTEWSDVVDGVWYNLVFYGLTDPSGQVEYNLNALYAEWYPACFLLAENLKALEERYGRRCKYAA